ncbi:MAG: nucleoid-associated protein [Mobilitalea sp.]
MSSIIENLVVNRIIIHEIFKRVESDHPSIPAYGDSLLIMSSKAMQALQQRLVEALGNNSHSIEMDINDRRPDGIPNFTKDLYQMGDAEFIIKSRYVAEKLSEAQVSMQIPGGIVIIINGTSGVNKYPCCAIIKAEVHTGFHKKEKNGGISAEYLSDLFLTPQQKLYKIGFFLYTKNETKVLIYDHNMTRLETKQAAKYFYESFLGCKIADSSKIITQNFFILTGEFINGLDIETEKKLDYQDNLYSYLKNKNDSTLSISEFSEKYLDLDHRDTYNTYMLEAAFPPIAIVKELDLIKNKLRRRKISFSSGVTIQRSSGNLKEVVSVIESSEESTTIKISGKIRDQLT